MNIRLVQNVLARDQDKHEHSSCSPPEEAGDEKSMMPERRRPKKFRQLTLEQSRLLAIGLQ